MTVTSGGAIAGGVVVAVMILGAVGVIVCWFWFRRAEKRKRTVTDVMTTLDQLRFVMLPMFIYSCQSSSK